MLIICMLHERINVIVSSTNVLQGTKAVPANIDYRIFHGFFSDPKL